MKSLISILIGSKEGPVGLPSPMLWPIRGRPFQSFGGARAQPGLQAGDVLITKVTIKGAQTSRADVRAGSKASPRPLLTAWPAASFPGSGRKPVIVCGVFIHWDAKDDAKIYEYNYRSHQAVDPAGHEGPAKIGESFQEGHGQTRSTSRTAFHINLSEQQRALCPRLLDHGQETHHSQLDSDVLLGVFDRVVAIDAGRTVFSYGESNLSWLRTLSVARSLQRRKDLKVPAFSSAAVTSTPLRSLDEVKKHMLPHFGIQVSVLRRQWSEYHGAASRGCARRSAAGPAWSWVAQDRRSAAARLLAGQGGLVRWPRAPLSGQTCGCRDCRP